MQSRGMELITVRNLVDSLEAEFIGCSISVSRFYSTTGQPGGESAAVVVAPPRGFPLGGRLSPELGSADDKGVLEQTPRFKIFEQCTSQTLPKHRKRYQNCQNSIENISIQFLSPMIILFL